MNVNKRNLLASLPLLTASVAGIGFYGILKRMKQGTYNPHAFSSPLIGKHLPSFSLPGACGLRGFSNTNLLNISSPVIINWFASWCSDCGEEASILNHLTMSGVAVWGIAYEDTISNLALYLKKFGTPYQRLGVDPLGLTAINWGVSGVPETYLIDKKGIVRLRYSGALNDDVLTNQIMPLLKQYS